MTQAANIARGTGTAALNLTAFDANGALNIRELLETATITAAAPSATTNFDVITQGVQYYTSNNTANFTLNIRGSSSVSLNSLLAVGQSVTMALLVTNGASAFYPNVVQVDGTNVTPKWSGGTAVTSGNVNAIDVYTFTIIKTAATPTYTVLGAQTQYK